MMSLSIALLYSCLLNVLYFNYELWVRAIDTLSDCVVPYNGQWRLPMENGDFRHPRKSKEPGISSFDQTIKIPLSHRRHLNIQKFRKPENSPHLH